MEFAGKLFKEKSSGVLAILLSAITSVVIYFVYDVSTAQLFILYCIQTLVLIPISLIRSFRFSLFRGLVEMFWWAVLLIVSLQIIKAGVGYISLDLILVGKEYVVIILLYLVLGSMSAVYGHKVISALELSFLNSLIFRRAGILFLSVFIGIVLMKFSPVTFAVISFILVQAVFELFILYQSLQFRTSSLRNVP